MMGKRELTKEEKAAELVQLNLFNLLRELRAFIKDHQKSLKPKGERQ